MVVKDLWAHYSAKQSFAPFVCVCVCVFSFVQRDRFYSLKHGKAIQGFLSFFFAERRVPNFIISDGHIQMGLRTAVGCCFFP